MMLRSKGTIGMFTLLRYRTGAAMHPEGESGRAGEGERFLTQPCFRLRVLPLSPSPSLPLLRRPLSRLRLNTSCVLIIPLLVFTTAGCDMLDMYDEPRFEPLEASTFFDDGTSARPLVAGTVARGDLREDEAFYSGKVDGKYVTELPLDLNRALLVRGQERFNIYCSPCHGRVGDGNGMIVQRGFRRPPSFVSSDRLLNSPVGHFYDVISHGFGAMPSYASRVEPHDRWAIVAYIRALQRSQNGTFDDVPTDLRDEIAESEAVQEQEREKRGAAERLDTERQQKLQRDIREHQRSPEQGERRHEELRRKEDSDRSSSLRIHLRREWEWGRAGEGEMFADAIYRRLRVLPLSHSPTLPL